MIKTSCVPRLAGDTFIIIRTSYVRICQGDVTAAALLHIFEQWHNTKLASRENHIDLDDRQGKETPLPTLWQFHKTKDLEDQLMGIGKRHSIEKARQMLVELGILQMGRNPNKKYKFDATTFYLFKPEVLTNLLEMLPGTSAFAENSSGPVPKSTTTTAENSKAIPKDSPTNNSGTSEAAQPPEATGANPEPVKDKTEVKDTDWQRWVDRYEDHVRQHNAGLTWPEYCQQKSMRDDWIGHNWKNGSQLGKSGLKGLREHLVSIAKAVEGTKPDDAGFAAFCYMLENWEKLENFLRKEFDLTVILKKITNIINQLKNGAQTNKGNNGGSGTGTSAQRVNAVSNY